MDINIRTIDRGKTNYIERTILSLAENKTFEDYKINVFDSGSENMGFLLFLNKYTNVEVKLPKKRTSALKNYIKTLRTNKDWVLVLGDDFIFCNNFFEQVELLKKQIKEDVRVVSFFLNYKEGLEEKGLLYGLPANKFWGGNILIRKKDAHNLADLMERKSNAGETKNMDMFIKEWHIGKYPALPIYLSTVGACQHIGDNSTLGYTKRREGFVKKGFPNYKI